MPRMPSMFEPICAGLGIAAIRAFDQTSSPIEIRAALINGNRPEATAPWMMTSWPTSARSSSAVRGSSNITEMLAAVSSANSNGPRSLTSASMMMRPPSSMV